MASRIYLLFVLALYSCNSSNYGTAVQNIGTPLEEQVGLFNAYGIETKNIFVFDSTTNRILGVNTDTMAINYKFELTNPGEQHYVAMDVNEKFVIDFSKRHLQVINLDGRRFDNPLKFLGTPISTAYNPNTRFMIIQDDLSSIGILKMTEDGAIEDSWLGGPLISEGKTIAAGDIDAAGRLVLTMSDGSITLVDLAATLTQKSWQSSNFSSGLTGLNWVAPDISAQNKVLVASEESVSVLDVATKAILETVDFNQSQLSLSSKYYRTTPSSDYYQQRYEPWKTVMGYSKAGKPHILAKTGTDKNPTLYYLGSDGKIKTHVFQNVTLGMYLQSYLSADGKEFVAVFKSDRGKSRVLGVRLSDNLVIRDKTISVPSGSVKINSKLLLHDFETGLGRIDLHNIADDTVKTTQGYNFEYLGQR